MTMTDDMLAAVGERFRGRSYAFTAWYDPSVRTHRLTVVVDGEAGHCPVISLEFRTDDDARRAANRLNSEALHLSTDTVASIIAQSMRRRA